MKRFILLVLVMLVCSNAYAIRTYTMLAATTSATQSDEFVVDQGIATTIIFTGTVAAGETATVQISNDGGATWVSSAEDVLTDTDLARVIVAPGRYRMNKTATAGAAGIAISR